MSLGDEDIYLVIASLLLSRATQITGHDDLLT